MHDFVPKISVAMCTYNGARFLSAQLDSILRQSIPVFEIIIVDDRSSDNTLDILKKYAHDYDNIRYYVNEHNLGFVNNFSSAISKTSGDYVALADQDDVWTDDHLEILLNNIGSKAVCVGDAIMIRSDGSETRELFSQIKQNHYIPSSDVYKAYRIVYNYNPYQGASMLIDRAWVDNLLPFSSRAGYHDTFLAGWACLTKGMSVIPNIVTKYRMHSGQVTRQWKVSLFDEIKHLRHRVCFPSKEYLIDCISEKAPVLSNDAIAFIKEFQLIRELDRQKKRVRVLKIMNRHYREIYSCYRNKFLILRSLHFLLSL